MSGPADAFEFFFEKPWSDGLPVVPPTEARLARMLGGTKRDPEETLGSVPPANEEATVREVALHAVMAGCRPEYLPVVIAGVEAMLIEKFNLNGVQATMHSAAPLMIVNGPYAKEIGLTGGSGCFGPGFRANATIGRALRLVMLNLGAGIPRVLSMSTFSQPARFTYCIAENEEESPWEPLSVTRGFGAEENVVSLVLCEGPKLVLDPASRTPERLFVGIADTMALMGSWNQFLPVDMVVALSPEHAAICAKAGLSKADVHRRLRETAGRRLGDLKRGPWWEGRIKNPPVPIDMDDDDAFVPAVFDPEDFHLIVAGGTPGPISAVMHGWNGAGKSVSKAFEA